MLEIALQSHLASSRAIAEYVDERIYPVKVPAGVVETAITYEVGGRDPLYDFSGASGLYAVEVEINCWSQSYQDAKELAALVKTQMEMFRGTIDNESIRTTFFRDETDRFEKPDPADEVGRYLVVLDFQVWQRS